MAQFTPRTAEDILADMIAHVQNHSTISDFSEGSAVRTTLEASTMELDEQYFQMTQILSVFSIYTARGEKLERRLADFGIARKGPKPAVGRVKFYDSNLVSDRISVDASAGTGSVYLFSSSVLPVNGFPYAIRIGEGTTRVQDVSVQFNNTTTNSLVLVGPLEYNVVVGDRVSLVTGSVARTVNAGYQVIVPATGTSPTKMYATQEAAFISAGNYFSNEVVAKSTTAGVSGNSPVGKVSSFLGGGPFTGAGVTSVTAMAGGREQESDDELVQRGVEQIQGLSRGTPLALKAAAKNVEDTTTGQRVLSSNLIEDFVHDEVRLYIDDGSGFVPDFVALPITTLTSTASMDSLEVESAVRFPSFGHVLVVDSPNTAVIPYNSVTPTTVELADNLPTSFASGSTVTYVDLVSSGTESNQLRFQLTNFPIVRNTETIYKGIAGVWSPLTRGVDYILNKGTGEFQLLTALPAGSQVAANYSYYINLVTSVQRVLEGDKDDELNFPGVKAAGIFLTVEAPAIRRITIRLSISAKPGFTEADLYDSVRSSVEQYITSLRLGDDVIVSRIYDAIHDNAGVLSARVLEPTQNQTILENELPVPYSASGASLVYIS